MKTGKIIASVIVFSASLGCGIYGIEISHAEEIISALQGQGIVPKGVNADSIVGMSGSGKGAAASIQNEMSTGIMKLVKLVSVLVLISGFLYSMWFIFDSMINAGNENIRSENFRKIKAIVAGMVALGLLSLSIYLSMFKFFTGELSGAIQKQKGELGNSKEQFALIVNRGIDGASVLDQANSINSLSGVTQDEKMSFLNYTSDLKNELENGIVGYIQRYCEYSSGGTSDTVAQGVLCPIGGTLYSLSRIGSADLTQLRINSLREKYTSWGQYPRDFGEFFKYTRKDGEFKVDYALNATKFRSLIKSEAVMQGICSGITDQSEGILLREVSEVVRSVGSETVFTKRQDGTCYISE